jgi:hypothetical protein
MWTVVNNQIYQYFIQKKPCIVYYFILEIINSYQYQQQQLLI